MKRANCKPVHSVSAHSTGDEKQPTKYQLLPTPLPNCQVLDAQGVAACAPGQISQCNSPEKKKKKKLCKTHVESCPPSHRDYSCLSYFEAVSIFDHAYSWSGTPPWDWAVLAYWVPSPDLLCSSCCGTMGLQPVWVLCQLCCHPYSPRLMDPFLLTHKAGRHPHTEEQAGIWER